MHGESLCPLEVVHMGRDFPVGAVCMEKSCGWV